MSFKSSSLTNSTPTQASLDPSKQPERGKKGGGYLLDRLQFPTLTLFLMAGAFAALSVIFIYVKMPILAHTIGGRHHLISLGKGLSILFGSLSTLGVVGFAAASVKRYLTPKDSN